MIIRLAISLILSMQVVHAEAQEAVHDGQYLVGSGVPGSVPYNIGVGLSSLAQLVLLPGEKISLSPSTTDGYLHSLEQLVDGTNEFAIVDSISAYKASNASGDAENNRVGDQFRVVATLWHEVDHFVIANEYVQSGTISDLAILRAEDLVTDLGNFDATRDILSRFGVRIDGGGDPVPFDWEIQRDNFDKGEIGGLAITGSVPSEAVQDLLRQSGGRAQMLELSHWQTSQVGEGWHVHTLTTNDYPELTSEVDTVARSLVLIAHRDVSEDAVYQIVKMMFDNLPFLTNLEPKATQISLDHALHHEINLPFHPGAARYYEEIGVLAEGGGDPGAAGLDAAAGHANHAALDHLQHGGGHQDGAAHPEHVHDEAMLTRARAEVHSGDVVLKIGRPTVLDHPGTEISMVYFNLGKTDLAGDELAKISRITGRIMAAYETYGREPEVYVEGHTDSSGSWEINYEIAHARARSVSDLLIAAGVPESWIHIADYSEQGLAIPTADGVAEERNRRVEITLIPQE